MKIGIDCRTLSGQMCGVARCVVNLVGALSKIDNSNQYTLFSNSEFIDDIKLKNNFKKVILRSKSNLIWEQFKLPQAIRKHKIDVFHCLQNQGLPYKNSCKAVLTVHDLIPKIFPDFWRNRSKITRMIYNLSLKISVGRSDKIIVVSNNTKRDLLKRFLLPENKISTIANGIEERFKPAEHPEEVYKNKFGAPKGYILHIAGICFNKNSTVVLSVFKKLKGKTGHDYRLLIAGEKNLFSKDFLNRADNIGGIIFTGHVQDTDMPLLYSGASVLLYPSIYEGFGFPVLEAMACGIPVVVSGNSSLPEVAGEAASYVNPFNIEDITEKTLAILENAPLRDSFIKKGLKRAKEFSWEKNAIETLKVYEGMIN